MSLAGSYASSASAAEELSDGELVDAVEKLRATNKHMRLENEVFLNHLVRNDPKLIAAMAHTLDLALRIQSASGMQGLTSQISLNVGRRSNESLFSATSRKSDISMLIGSSLADPKHRVNYTMKIELLNRERKNRENAYESFVKRSRLSKENLTAELEETSVQIAELGEARDVFEQSVVRDGTDPITQRIPAERLLRYMDEWLRSAESIIGKLRLRTSTFRYRRRALQHQLRQKEELGETLHPVDFEHMHIENRRLVARIESRNGHLLELKRTTGEANLVLSKHKLFLQEQLRELAALQERAAEFRAKTDRIRADIAAVEGEVQVSADQLDNIQDLVDTYEIPDIIEYVCKKKELHGLKRNKSIWERRNHIQKIALDTCAKTLQRISLQGDQK